MKKDCRPEFSTALLHPKYWPVWLGFGLLALFVNLLPYRLLLLSGQTLGLIGMKVGSKRIHIARRNLELAFTNKDSKEIDSIVRENFKNTGLALIETGIAWFWPTWRFKRLLTQENTEVFREFEQQGKGALVCFTHALNLEITARAFGALGLGGHGVYRPHSNPAYDFIQAWGRTHGGNTILDRRDLKGMIRALKHGDRVFYLGDHDYGHNKSVFVPFFDVEEACTVTGSSILAYTSKCAIVTGSGWRNSNGKYDIIIDPPIHDEYPQDDPKAAAAFLNKHLEKVILRGLDQWMWLHKRFKSMPDHSMSNSRYL
ncbi:LpxL/LpxP family Kdo(2)-lipid IV(A) lauroyl/palmitoleoyl acyltransferase [Vibrio makurazakiensis]|uniref:LpxL/LpxP family Kdo(2)-lipid IV(A) lauroyl/palmitoleoyl acyltransferase n=1 Tax=Vibrio makurazakiensis TaxID=2910250 RepID=UPI003D0D332E